GAEEVRPELGDALVDRAQAVHAVDYENDLLPLRPRAILLADGVGDRADRQPHAAARMDPGHAERPRARADRAPDAPDDLALRRVRLVLEQRDPAPRRAGALRGETDR